MATKAKAKTKPAKKVAAKPAAKKSKAKAINGTYEEIKRTVENMAEDVTKFDGGTQAAGSRVRKGAQEIKKLCQQLRQEVTEIKNGRKK